MILFITSDTSWEARIEKVLDKLQDSGVKSYFEKKNYGESLKGINIILMCRNPDLKFKQRIRFIKKEKELYIDIMLDLNQFKQIDLKEKEKIIADKFTDEIPAIVAKYKFEDFDFSRFKSDLLMCMNKLR